MKFDLTASGLLNETECQTEILFTSLTRSIILIKARVMKEENTYLMFVHQSENQTYCSRPF